MVETLKIEPHKLIKPSTYAKENGLDKSTVYIWLKDKDVLRSKGFRKIEIDKTLFLYPL